MALKAVEAQVSSMTPIGLGDSNACGNSLGTLTVAEQTVSEKTCPGDKGLGSNGSLGEEVTMEECIQIQGHR